MVCMYICLTNRRRKVQQQRSSTGSNRKHTMAPLAVSLYSPRMTLEHSLQPAGISFMLVFAAGGKQENPEENPPSREENQHKLNPLMVSGLAIEPGPHWWEVSALTTVPTLLP